MASDLLHQIRLHGAVPKHVAIIMDGTGRWAAARGLPRHAGHRQGMTSVREVVKAAVDAGIEVLTLFAFSTENWQRPRREVDALMRLLLRYLRTEVKKLMKNEVRVQAIGDVTRLPDPVRRELDRVIELTQDELHRGQEKTQELTKDYTERLEKVLKAKEDEIMEV